jgi:hypothetical protein
MFQPFQSLIEQPLERLQLWNGWKDWNKEKENERRRPVIRGHAAWIDDMAVNG